MNSVQMWKCPCGKRFKAIWQSTGQLRTQRTVICPNCNCSTEIDDSESLQIQIEIAPGVWRDLEEND